MEQKKNKSGLTADEIQEIRSIYKMQKDEKHLSSGAGWDFWEERVHMENLFCARFNYLILCYSLFVTAFATLEDKTSKLVILLIGFVVLLTISIFLRRAWEKLDILLKIVFNMIPEESNGLSLIEKLVNKRTSFHFIKKYNKMAGVWLPRFLYISFLVAFLAILFGWWIIE